MGIDQLLREVACGLGDDLDPALDRAAQRSMLLHCVLGEPGNRALDAVDRLEYVFEAFDGPLHLHHSTRTAEASIRSRSRG